MTLFFKNKWGKKDIFVDTFSLGFLRSQNNVRKLWSKIFQLGFRIIWMKNKNNKQVLFSSHCVTVSQDKARLLERRSPLKVCLTFFLGGGPLVCLSVCWTTVLLLSPYCLRVFFFSFIKGELSVFAVVLFRQWLYFKETFVRFSESAERRYKEKVCFYFYFSLRMK